jgi:hypothetical protein
MTKPASSSKAGPSVSASRRWFLETSVVTIAAAGFVSLTGTALALAAAKKSKEEAKYQNKPNGQQQCSKCKHFMAGKCEIVEGEISPDGWCKFFEAKG